MGLLYTPSRQTSGPENRLAELGVTYRFTTVLLIKRFNFKTEAIQNDMCNNRS